MGRVLFYRDFHGFTGGHLKVWNYFNHTLQSQIYQPYISFTPNSVWDSTNPWSLFPEQVVGGNCPRSAGKTLNSSPQGIKDFGKNAGDILFLAGLDWLRLPEEIRRNPPVPIINLIQGFRHADLDHTCYQFLQYPAIRICVSQEIKAAIEATGRTKGKIFVIPNGIDLEKFRPPAISDRPKSLASNQVTIVGLKQPQLAHQLRAQLQTAFPENQFRVIDTFLPRHEFIQCLQESPITIFLPSVREGFYLPALEGMAAGTLVICPDCVGNRSFCLDNWNCWRPEYKLGEIFQAVEKALTSAPSKRQKIQCHAQLTVAKHDLIAERRAYLEILAQASQLWQELWQEL